MVIARISEILVFRMKESFFVSECCVKINYYFRNFTPHPAEC
jgi:hypothetical protein